MKNCNRNSMKGTDVQEMQHYVESLVNTQESVIEYHDENHDESEAQCVFDEFREWFFAIKEGGPLSVLALPYLKNYE